MNWFFLTLVSVLSLSVANIFQRVAMKEEESDPLASSVLFLLLLGTVTGVYAIVNGFVFPPVREYAGYFILSSLLYAAGSLAMFHAVKRMQASEVSIISAFGAIVSIVLAILVLNERFSVLQGIGTACILTAIVVLKGTVRFSKISGFLYAMTGAACYAIAVVSDVIILKRYDAASYTSVMSFLPALVLMIYKPHTVVAMKNAFTNTGYMNHMFWYSCLYGIQAVTFYMAIGYGANVSQMAPIMRSQIILTVILSAIFLKERDKIVQKIISSVLVTIGIFLIR